MAKLHATLTASKPRIRLRITGLLAFLLGIGFGCVSAYAQTELDTTLTLSTIEVAADGVRETGVGGVSVTYGAEEIEASPVANVGELLAAEGVYVKQYGPGSLATSSARGGGAGHTLVLWNGLPIQSPMLGLLDLSLLPLGSFERVRWSPGGATAKWGSGAVGGTLQLDDRPVRTDGIEVAFGGGAGSFGYREAHAAVRLGADRLQSETRVAYVSADNDFKYRPFEAAPKLRQTNADYEQWLVNQSVYWQLSTDRQLAFHGWWQQSARGIPPVTTQRSSSARQDDAAQRYLLTYTDRSHRIGWKAKLAVFDESIDFRDSRIRLIAPSGFTSLLGELSAEAESSDGHHRLALSHTQVRTCALAQGYLDGTVTEHRAALLAAYRLVLPKLQVQVDGRQEIVDGRFVPATAAVGVELPWDVTDPGRKSQP